MSATLVGGLLAGVTGVVSSVVGAPPAWASGSAVFTYTGSAQTWTVPSGVTAVLADLTGGAGAAATTSPGGPNVATQGGNGGRELAVVSVTPGQVLQVNVGGAGNATAGGFNGGGTAPSTGGGGGGASDVRYPAGDGSYPLTNRLVVAAGGGGGSSAQQEFGYGTPTPGAPGGGAVGGSALHSSGYFGGHSGGQGGTQSAGGAGGDLGGVAGTLGQGGDAGGGASCGQGGGGGGGYYGGGGGSGGGCGDAGSGGGGGSSYPPPGATASSASGWTAGNGTVTIYYPAQYGIAFLGGHPLLTTEKRGGCPCDDSQIVVPRVAGPVDPGSGFQSLSVDDLATTGRGPAFDFQRTYNSDMAGTDGPLGLGWTDSYNMSLSFGTGTPPSTVTVNEETGGQIVFDYNATSATYAPDVPRDQATLVSNTSGPAWTFTRGAKSIFDFNSSGQLIDEKDLNGNTTTVGAVSGGTQTITDAAGRTFTLTYSGTHITSVAEETGGSMPARTVTYTYTGSLLTSVTDVNGGVTDYGYDTSNRLAVERSPRYHSDGALPAAPTSCASGAPLHSTGTVYNSSSQAICQWDALGRQTTLAYGSPSSSNPDITNTTVTDPKGNQTVYAYMQGTVVSVTKGYGTSAAGTWSYIYDPDSGGVAFTIDPDGHTSSTSYDQAGNMVASTDALGRTSAATYDSLHDPLTVTDPKGVTTTNTYDAEGNLLTSSTPLLDASGNPVMNGSNPVVATTTYVHGNSSHPEDVTAKTDADGYTWSYTYDGPTGYLISATAPSTTDNVEHPGTAQSNETLYAYDTVKGWPTVTLSARGQQATGATPSISYTCTPPATGCTTTAYTDATRSSGYDLWGDPTVVTDPNGHGVTKHWDADHNLDTSTDANANTTLYAYDAAEEQTVTTLPDGTVTRTDYNGDGTVADTVDALGATTSYGYDAQARVTSSTDPLSRATSYGYDPAGNKVTKADPGGSCPSWPITYPPTLTPSQLCTVWRYDAANEPTGTYYSDGVTPNVTAVGYDADGQRTSMSDGTSTAWSWGWDSLHRLTTTTDDQNKAVTYGYADSTKTGTGQQGQELLYGPTAITYPGSPTVVANRHYDPAGRMDCLTTGSSVAECTAGATGAGQLNYTWDADANLNVSTANLPSSTTVADTTTYDKADQVTGITAAKNATNFATFSYGRDNANQVNSVTSTGVPTDNHSYTYNPLEQLKTTDTTLYGYDGSGNLTTTLAGATQYYDKANEVTASVAGPGITLVGSSTAAGATGTTLTVNYPSGTKSGDWLVLAATMGYPNTLTVPSGWTQVVKKSSGSVSGTSDTTYVLRHKASTETSVTITFSGTFARAVAVAAYRGVASTSPVDVSGSASTNGGTTVTTPSVTTTAAGDRVIVATGAYTASTGTWAPPATMTARAESGTASPVVALDDQGQQTAGATGTRGAIYSQTSQLTGIVVALKPATTQPTATTYAYDTRGNRTGATPPTGSASTLGYDQADRLTSFTQGTTSASYTYDGDGLRMTKTVNGTKATFTWDETTAIESLLYDGTENYVYGPDGSLVEQVDNSGNQDWYHHDQIGSTRVMSDNTGTVLSTFTYDAYGNQTAHTGTTSSPFGFNGEYTDSETAFVYLRGRYYDSGTGQFITRDPLLAVTAAPYKYVQDNPLNGEDPLGLADHTPLYGATQLEEMDCAKLMNYINRLIAELKGRDTGFKRNKEGFDYDDPRYADHVSRYRDVQATLNLALAIYRDKGCDLSSQKLSLILYWATKDPAPLGHPGKKPHEHRSLLEQLADDATIVLPGGIRIPVPIDV